MIRRSPPRASTWSRSTSTHSRTPSPRDRGTSIRDEVADRAIAKLGELLPEPARLDPRAPGTRPARPRARARDLGRPRAPRRDGVRPALQPAAGARVGRVPDADPRPLAVRGGHPPRRRRHRCERPQLRARGASAKRAGCGHGSGVAVEPALPGRLGRDRGARGSRPSRRGRAAARSSSGSSALPTRASPGGLSPLALAAKTGWTVTDVDGNVYLDCASASASVPLGAGRTEIARAGDRRDRAVRQRGHPRTRLGADGRAGRAAAGRHARRASPATTSRSTAPRRSRSRSR